MNQFLEIIQKQNNMNKKKLYLFVDRKSGELFFVKCATISEAWNIVNKNFGIENYIEFYGTRPKQDAELISSVYNYLK